MTLRKNPPSIIPTFTRAAQGKPPAMQGHTRPAPESRQSLDMPGPGGHAVRHSRFQDALARMKARLSIAMPSKETGTPSRMDSIRKEFYDKAKAISNTPKKNVGEPERQPAKIKEKFNDLSI